MAEHRRRVAELCAEIMDNVVSLERQQDNVGTQCADAERLVNKLYSRIDRAYDILADDEGNPDLGGDLHERIWLALEILRAKEG